MLQSHPSQFEAVEGPSTSSNNQNMVYLALANTQTLERLGINVCAYALIHHHHEQHAIFLHLDDTVGLNQIILHPNLFRALQSHQIEVHRASLASKFWLTRTHEENSKLNLFPRDAQTCKYVELAIIRNRNSTLVDANLMRCLVSAPFLCRVGQIITLNLSEANREIEHKLPHCNAMSKLASKILKYRLVDSLQYYYQDAQIFVEVVSTDDLIKDHYFIVDFTATTQIKFQDYLKNCPKVCSQVLGPSTQRSITLNEQIYQLPCLRPLQDKIQEWIHGAQQVSICVLETQKKYAMHSKSSLGKRVMMKRLATLNGFSYYEKDISTLSSVNKLDNVFLKTPFYAPCLIYLRNYASLKQLLSLKHSADIAIHLELYWTQLRKSVIARVMELNLKARILIILSVESLFDFDHLRANSDQIYQFRYKYDEQIGNLMLQAYGLNYCETETTQLQLLLKRVPWRQSEKVISQSSVVDFPQLIKKIEGLSRTEVLSNVKVSSQDIGGMESVLEEIAKTITLPQLHPEIFDELVKPRRGVLFFGPPGTGKTLMAKCVANECNMNFISVKGPEMLNMYIGESEKNIRDLFQRARDNAPCIVFFDELDALAPSRGNRSDSNQVMDRIVAQFLTEIDQLKEMVFIIGATNRPDLLDSSLLTPGRFDKLIYLGIKDDAESRLKIIRAQTRRVKLHDDVDLQSLLDVIPPRFTGADFQGLTSAALLNASKRIITTIESQYDQTIHATYSQYLELMRLNRPEIRITQQDFIDALPLIKPSVTEQDLIKYKELQLKYCS